MLRVAEISLNITISYGFDYADSTAFARAISLPWTDGFYEDRETVGFSFLF